MTVNVHYENTWCGSKNNSYWKWIRFKCNGIHIFNLNTFIYLFAFAFAWDLVVRKPIIQAQNLFQTDKQNWIACIFTNTSTRIFFKYEYNTTISRKMMPFLMMSFLSHLFNVIYLAFISTQTIMSNVSKFFECLPSF